MNVKKQMGKVSREIGVALQTEGKQTRRGYSIPEYIKTGRQITDACGWPKDAKNLALRNAIHLGIKNPMVYQKCLEGNKDTLTANRVIEIVTDIHNSDCQRPTMQTNYTAFAAATAMQQGSTQVHKLQENHQEDGKSEKGHGKKYHFPRQSWNEATRLLLLRSETSSYKV